MTYHVDELRSDTLSQISGFQVACYHSGGVRYFVFSFDGQTVKTVCNYRKAKLFAEGVKIGRQLDNSTS
jgi:hypothetical protein